MLRNSRIIKRGILFLIAPMLLFGAFITGSRYAKQNMQISYISQGEILSMEKARIARGPRHRQELFFGRPEIAVKYIEEEREHLSKNGARVLLSDSKIYGGNISSVSDKVHARIIARLKSYVSIQSEDEAPFNSVDIHAKF